MKQFHTKNPIFFNENCIDLHNGFKLYKVRGAGNSPDLMETGYSS